ncbi:MAG: M20/M25/M40 family metallo-hydrolase [Acidobacteria bacterium]|nr:M20/M25/M40 family metallo-hydrolase [Acidobacteriota bacterium]
MHYSHHSERLPWRVSAVLAGALILAAAPGSFAQETADPLGKALLGPTGIIEDLRYLCDVIGGRVTGTPACERSIDWAVERFRQAGIENVRTEKFQMPAAWEELTARAEAILPTRFPIRVASMGYSPSTPEGGIVAPVVDIGEGREIDFRKAGEKVRGGILLLRSEILDSLENLFLEYLRLPGIIQRAEEAGALALVEVSTRPRNLLYRHVAAFGVDVDLPIALASREDSMRLLRLLDAGEDVQIRLALDNRSRAPFESRNVVAEIRGSERPEEIVVLGAHLDSWALGTGALDNGCNVALVIDIARAIQAMDRKPSRTIRFVLFTGEEQGMWGSRGYVRAHRNEMDRHVAAVIVDLGSGRIEGFSLGGRSDLKPAIEEILSPFKDWNAGNHTTDAFVGTDNFDFLLEGVPNLVANQDAAPYLPEYHAESDTFDKIDIETLKANTALVGLLIRELADLPDRLGPRQNRAEVANLMAETGVGGQMRTFGFWIDWEERRRGRTE